MKILLLNQIPEVNNKYSFSLCKAVKDLNVDIVLYSIDTDDMSLCPVDYYNEFSNYSIIKSKLKKVLSYYNSWKKIMKLCKEKKIDIIHVQWYIFSPLDYLFHKILKKMNIKVVATIHDLMPFDKKVYDNYYIKKIYCEADHLIIQCKDIIPKLQNCFGIEINKMSYVEHGHYMEFQEKATYEESINFLEIDSNSKVILFFGQIKKVKGLHVLLKAMQKVLIKHKDVILIIAGKEWKDDFKEYEEEIIKLNIQNNIKKYIRFIKDEEIKFFFTASNLVVLPYLESYQSGVVHLSYAYEKPVIASNIGDFKQVIKNGVTGELVEVNNDVELADRMISLLESPEKCLKYGKSGKSYIAENYSWKEIGNKTITIYNNLLKGDI